MKRIACCYFVAAMLLAAPVQGDEPTFESGVDTIFAEYDSTHSPGCAVGVFRNGKVAHARAYGMADLERNVSITPQTVFHIASVSKQFTAASIALLEEQGKISLQDDLRKYVPELPDYGHKITLQHLVHHTSGLRDYQNLLGLSGRSISESLSDEEALAILTRQKHLNFVPGEQHSYSNSGYVLMALIVERVSGLPLADFAARNIFNPLGMTHTRYYAGNRSSTPYTDDTSPIMLDRAVGYLAGNEGLGFRIVRNNFDGSGAGGMVTSLEDLARWDQNFNDNKLGKGGPALIERMLSVQPLRDGKPNNYAYGLIDEEYRGLKTLTHSGGLGGWTAYQIRFPDQGFTVAVLCNQGRIKVGTLVKQTADLYLTTYLSIPIEKEKPAQTAPAPGISDLPSPSADRIAQYVGDYASDELDAVFRVRVDDGKLQIKVGSAPLRPLVRIAADKEQFAFDHVNRMTFKRDRRGRVDRIEFNAERIRSLVVPKAMNRDRAAAVGRLP